MGKVAMKHQHKNEMREKRMRGQEKDKKIRQQTREEKAILILAVYSLRTIAD